MESQSLFLKTSIFFLIVLTHSALTKYAVGNVPAPDRTVSCSVSQGVPCALDRRFDDAFRCVLCTDIEMAPRASHEGGGRADQRCYKSSAREHGSNQRLSKLALKLPVGNILTTSVSKLNDQRDTR